MFWQRLPKSIADVAYGHIAVLNPSPPNVRLGAILERELFHKAVISVGIQTGAERPRADTSYMINMQVGGVD
jgi:hypothetical protein